jgi:phage FluMu protein Com
MVKCPHCKEEYKATEIVLEHVRTEGASYKSKVHSTMTVETEFFVYSCPKCKRILNISK